MKKKDKIDTRHINHMDQVSSCALGSLILAFIFQEIQIFYAGMFVAVMMLSIYILTSWIHLRILE